MFTRKEALIGAGIFILCLLIGTWNIKDKLNDEAIPFLDFNPFKNNSTAQSITIAPDGRMLTKTVLSEEDAKKPCKSCHLDGKY